MQDDKRQYDITNRVADNDLKTVFRHNSIHKAAIDHMINEAGCKKSEAVRMIIEEWLYYVAGK
ncbi:hypothetical protein KA005_00400 [bacterium]|nr:hypothetical protein [bacterium]